MKRLRSEKRSITKIRLFNSYTDNPDALKELTIHAGTNLLSESGVVYTASRAIAHENFNSLKLNNDIGLLILSTAVEFTALVQPISLAETDVAPAGHSCILSGWGRTSVSSSNKTIFYIIKVHIHTQNFDFI